jgi:type III restriction enzyme
VLWLVPTNTIRTQTIETLKKPGNPNYETLNAAFEGKVRVLDIAEFSQLTPGRFADPRLRDRRHDADSPRH